MLWRTKKSPVERAQEVVRKTDEKVDIHKIARIEAVEDAKSSTNEFKKLFKENGFTIKIYLAAGGNPPKH